MGGRRGRCLQIDSLFNRTQKKKAVMNGDFIWVEFLPALLKSPCDCASSWVWVPGEALLALERLCAACTPVEGMNSSRRGGELECSRLTGATDKTEAMLDQQPKTNQVKQQPHSSSGCWASLTRSSRDSQKDCKSVLL